MNLIAKFIATGFSVAALAAIAAPAQAQPYAPAHVAVGSSNANYAPVQYYRDGYRNDRRGYDRRYDRRGHERRGYDRWDNRRGHNGWNGSNGWNNDRRYRQRCWTEWRHDRWRGGRYKVRICR